MTSFTSGVLAGVGAIARILEIYERLDQKAIEAVSRWRFDPATKDGKPVAVWIAVETSFHLYNKN